MATSAASTQDPIKVAIAGPSGRPGSRMITRFLLSTTPAFELTLLTRSGSVDKTTALLKEITTQCPSLSTPAITAIPQEDYTNPTALTPYLKGQAALLMLLNRNVLPPQFALIDAAIAAGVSHIIPSAFGISTHHPYLRSNPATAEKVLMEDHLHSAIASQPQPQSQSDAVTTYTAINTGIFLDYAMALGIFISTSPQRPTFLCDGGTAKLAASTYEDIATATRNATILGVRRDPRVVNKDVYVQPCSISQNQLLGYARDSAPDRERKTIPVDTTEAEKESRRKFEQGDKSPEAMRGFLMRGSFGMGLGEFQAVDNGWLGVEERGEDWVKEMVGGYL